MEAGQIIERGNHAELLASQGRYASMWALQQNTESSPAVASTAAAT
jgi:ATP-binding cassette subfamily B protein